MNDDTKQKITLLLEELVNTPCSESRQVAIKLELDKLSPDPFWSDYIFWSEEYVNENGDINYEAFFDKISESEFFKVVVTISRIKRLLIFAVVALLQDLVLSDPQAYSSLPLDYPSVWDFQL